MQKHGGRGVWPDGIDHPLGLDKHNLDDKVQNGGQEGRSRSRVGSNPVCAPFQVANLQLMSSGEGGRILA